MRSPVRASRSVTGPGVARRARTAPAPGLVTMTTRVRSWTSSKTSTWSPAGRSIAHGSGGTSAARSSARPATSSTEPGRIRPARRGGAASSASGRPSLVERRLLGAVDHDLLAGGGGGEGAPQPAIDPAQGRGDDRVVGQEPVGGGRLVDDRERHPRQIERGGGGGEPPPVGDGVGVAAEVGAAARAEREQLGDQRRDRIEHRRGEGVVAVDPGRDQRDPGPAPEIVPAQPGQRRQQRGHPARRAGPAVAVEGAADPAVAADRHREREAAGAGGQHRQRGGALIVVGARRQVRRVAAADRGRRRRGRRAGDPQPALADRGQVGAAAAHVDRHRPADGARDRRQVGVPRRRRRRGVEAGEIAEAGRGQRADQRAEAAGPVALLPADPGHAALGVVVGPAGRRLEVVIRAPPRQRVGVVVEIERAGPVVGAAVVIEGERDHRPGRSDERRQHPAELGQPGRDLGLVAGAGQGRQGVGPRRLRQPGRPAVRGPGLDVRIPDDALGQAAEGELGLDPRARPQHRVQAGGGDRGQERRQVTGAGPVEAAVGALVDRPRHRGVDRGAAEGADRGQQPRPRRGRRPPVVQRAGRQRQAAVTAGG